MLTIILYSLAVILVLAGLAGTVFPALPGLPLMLAGFFLAAWADDFHKVGSYILILLTLITVIGMAIDFFAGMLSAKKSGASKEALTGALLGTIAGLFLGLIGVIVGPVVGAMAGEWIARRNSMQASKAGFATLIGLIIGTVAKLGCAFAMLSMFTLAILF